ncbi:hypothetical protein F4802DRAFT_596555 [Xylaria palmicola]|nr:hypothetical protein F4802DRAFT_596555 [Xylaria palmicola]
MSERGIKKWSEEEKIRFLVQTIKQMQTAGGKFNFQEVVIPGRTPKALRHLWDKLSGEFGGEPGEAAAAAGGGGGDAASPGSEPATPAPKSGKATPGSRKRTAKAATAATGEGDDAGDGPATPTVKRQRKTPTSKSKAKTAPMNPAGGGDGHEDVKPEIEPEQDRLDQGEA